MPYSKFTKIVDWREKILHQKQGDRSRDLLRLRGKAHNRDQDEGSIRSWVQAAKEGEAVSNGE